MLHAETADVGLFGSMSRYGDLGMHVVIDVRRNFSRDQLEGAVEGAIRAFPVLGRCYEPRFWRDRWRKVEGPVSEAVHVVDDLCDVEAETASWARRPIDATGERPIRVVSLRRGHGSRLVLTLTHLAVDGGGVAAVGHVFGAHLYGVPPSLPVDARRDMASALERLRWFHLPVLARDLAAAAILPLRTLGAAKRERPFPTDPSQETKWRHVSLSAHDVEAIKARCRPRGASVNDALIAALAQVGAGRSRGSGPVAVMYTMDLRRYARSARLTAANTSSILMAIVPRHAITDLAATAEAVAAITSRQRRGLAGPAFVLGALALGIGSPHAFVRQFVRWLHPIIIEMPLSRGLIFTNVGKIDDGLSAFGADVEAIRVIGPSVDGVVVPAVVAFGFRGELHLELFGAPGLAAGALDELERELRTALELPGSAPSVRG